MLSRRKFIGAMTVAPLSLALSPNVLAADGYDATEAKRLVKEMCEKFSKNSSTAYSYYDPFGNYIGVEPLAHTRDARDFFIKAYPPKDVVERFETLGLANKASYYVRSEVPYVREYAHGSELLVREVQHAAFAFNKAFYDMFYYEYWHGSRLLSDEELIKKLS